MGLAAGFDKNGDALSGLLKLNFSFIEIGTVTPLSQEGNSKPRLHRIRKESSIINRLAFQIKGFCIWKKIYIKLENIIPGKEPIIGVNIGCNKNQKILLKILYFACKKYINLQIILLLIYLLQILMD